MKTLYGLVLSCALLVFAPVAAVAQFQNLQGTTPEERAEIVTKWMQENLSLDDKTAAEASAINLKFAKQSQSIMDSDASRMDRMKTFRKESQARDAELKAIFTPEQFSLYKQKQASMREQLRERIQEKQKAAQ